MENLLCWNFPNARLKRKKKCQLLFISYINSGNLVLPQNTGRLDELDSSQFILHRNGSLKKKGPRICIKLWLDRAQNEFTVSLRDVAGLMREGWCSAGWVTVVCSFIPSAGTAHAQETEVSLIMHVSRGHSLIF